MGLGVGFKFLTVVEIEEFQILDSCRELYGKLLETVWFTFLLPDFDNSSYKEIQAYVNDNPTHPIAVCLDLAKQKHALIKKASHQVSLQENTLNVLDQKPKFKSYLRDFSDFLFTRIRSSTRQELLTGANQDIHIYFATIV
jgi:hypothetical protein